MDEKYKYDRKNFVSILFFKTKLNSLLDCKISNTYKFIKI